VARRSVLDGSGDYQESDFGIGAGLRRVRKAGEFFDQVGLLINALMPALIEWFR
jgi:hypothetical protein